MYLIVVEIVYDWIWMFLFGLKKKNSDSAMNISVSSMILHSLDQSVGDNRSITFERFHRQLSWILLRNSPHSSRIIEFHVTLFGSSRLYQIIELISTIIMSDTKFHRRKTDPTEQYPTEFGTEWSEWSSTRFLRILISFFTYYQTQTNWIGLVC